MKRFKSKVISIILTFIMMLSLAPSGIVYADGAEMTDKEAVEAVFEEYTNTNKKYLAATPLIFPYEYNEKTYTNVVEFLKDWAKEKTGKDITVEYEVNNGSYTTFSDWSTGENVRVDLWKDTVPIEENGDINQIYNQNNADKISIGLKNVVFKCGEESSETITQIMIKIKSLIRDPEYIVNYVKGQFPFARIANGNTQDRVVKPLGEMNSTGKIIMPILTSPSGTSHTCMYSASGATPTVAITWNFTHVSGAEDAITYNSTTQPITIKRPNVGEEDAKFKLSASIVSKTDSNVKAETDPFDLTVPAFEAVKVPIEVDKDASLEIKDPDFGSKAVDPKYIVKQEGGSEDRDTYVYTLHTKADGTAQTFNYTIKKEGYHDQTGKITVSMPAEGDTLDKVVTEPLTQSTQADSQLSALSFKAPSGLTLDFKSDVYEYNVEVESDQYVQFNAPTVATKGASVQLKYYKNQANANAGTLSTSSTLTSKCYLPDTAGSTTDITFIVTGPAGSLDEFKTKEYVVHVKKNKASDLLTDLSVSVPEGTAGMTNSIGRDGMAEEEKLSQDSTTFTYNVNYLRDKIVVTPTAADCTITVNGQEVASGSASSPISLEFGENTIPIVVKKGGLTSNYSLKVRRKADLRITSYGVENGKLAETPDIGTTWTSAVATTMPSDTETAKVIINSNVTDADVIISCGGGEYTGKAGEPIEVPTDGKSDKLMMTIWLSHKVSEVTETQKFVCSIAREKSFFASSVESYLPAPGQFVNGGDSWGNPIPTLTANSGITLGAFGGNVVYKFDEAITDDPANPYGVDFIVTGNVFSNSDGSSASGASEPAAVMVSQDGETWYELAGSAYFEDGTIHGYSVTYTNSDTTFAAAADVPWTDNLNNTGAVLKNTYHTQSYYPNPTYYNKFQTGVGKNTTYTAESVTFSGTRLAKGSQPVFGYADNHYAALNGKDNTASNPYKDNHYVGCNGDGFDLAWAVDADGKPVKLSSVNYVKVYSPQLLDGGATGEVSPEVYAVARAKKAESAVGTSTGLTSLSVGGKEVTLSIEKNTYDIELGRETSTSITPVSAGSNIYVNNSRVESGKELKGIKVTAGTTKTVRIIVQDGEKAPALYYLNLSSDKISQEELDQAAAAEVDGQIAAIGTVSLDSGDKIGAARNAYDGLTDAQKKHVKNLAILTNAENELTRLRNQSLGQVRVIVENTTFTKESAAKAGKPWDATFWTGTLVDRKVELNAGDDMMTCLVKALTAAGKTQQGAELGYVSMIAGIEEGDGGKDSGWMCTLNDWFTNEGANAFTAASGKLLAGDTIKFLYTMDMGNDIGSKYDSIDSIDTGLSALSSDVGSISPKFAKNTKAYTLEVPYGTKSIALSASAVNKNFNVVYKVGNKEYRRSAAVPVSEGTVISVICGEGPSMSQGQPTTYKLTVRMGAKKIPITSLKLNSIKEELTVGGTKKLKVTYQPSNATETSVKWTSSDSKIAAVKASGLEATVTAKKEGNCNITAATADGSKKVVCKVTVKKKRIKVQKIKVTGLKSSIKVNQKLKLTASVSPANATDKTIKWENLTPKTISISGSGKNVTVTGKKAGKASIKVKAADNVTKEITFKVIAPVKVKSVKLNKSSLSLNKGKEAKLTATISPSNADNKNLTWTSSASKIVKIIGTGKQVKIKGLKKGTAVVKVTTKDGKKTAKCKVIVK